MSRGILFLMFILIITLGVFQFRNAQRLAVLTRNVGSIVSVIQLIIAQHPITSPGRE